MEFSKPEQEHLLRHRLGHLDWMRLNKACCKPHVVQRVRAQKPYMATGMATGWCICKRLTYTSFPVNRQSTVEGASAVFAHHAVHQDRAIGPQSCQCHVQGPRQPLLDARIGTHVRPHVPRARWQQVTSALLKHPNTATLAMGLTTKISQACPV